LGTAAAAARPRAAPPPGRRPAPAPSAAAAQGRPTPTETRRGRGGGRGAARRGAPRRDALLPPPPPTPPARPPGAAPHQSAAYACRLGGRVVDTARTRGPAGTPLHAPAPDASVLEVVGAHAAGVQGVESTSVAMSRRRRRSGRFAADQRPRGGWACGAGAPAHAQYGCRGRAVPARPGGRRRAQAPASARRKPVPRRGGGGPREGARATARAGCASPCASRALSAPCGRRRAVCGIGARV